MSDEFDPADMLRGDVPQIDEVALLADNHPMLAQRIDPFDFEGDARDPKAIADLLIDAMLKWDGIGIAANQIGVHCRAFAILLQRKHAVVMFNPAITELSSETVMMTEGCLSFPGLALPIARPEKCRVNYHDVAGVRQTLLLTGLDARVALHEMDHLNGVVMTSKVSRLKLDMAKKRARKLR